jgi:hypothetical protein
MISSMDGAIMLNTQCALVAATVAAMWRAGAQSPTEQAASMHQEILVNGGDFPHSETDFRLEDHQQLKDYFFGRRREPLRGDDCRSCQR